MTAATSKSVEFFLPVPPRPASRPRFACRGRFAQAYTDAAYKAWQEQAKAALAEFRPFAEAHEGDVEIDFTVLVPRPKKTVKVRPSGDVDNYAKGLYDAITQVGGFWKDDDQIIIETVRKRWAFDHEQPGYYVGITFL